MAETHECPANLCRVELPRHLLMCVDHWHMVPFDLSRAVIREWNLGNPTRLHRGLSLRAVKAVNDYLQSRGVA